MHFNCLLILGIAAAQGLALPHAATSETSTAPVVPCFGNSLGCIFVGDATDKVRDSPSLHSSEHGISKRAMNPNQQYPGQFGRAFKVGKIIVREIGNRAGNRFLELPSDDGVRHRLAVALANAVTSTIGDGSAQLNWVDGSWTIACKSFHFDFSDINWNTMYQMAFDALQSAGDWIPRDNYVAWEIHDATRPPGEAAHDLFWFAIFPSALSGIQWSIFDGNEWNDGH
ncbi:hypothetical protein B0T16DRAFT_518705 [Cercophora newfieldiana]|uniref:Uncharacterized protein n=1 Tax=Cercophora newfieldiana TaxID=92897 RepID=A0AA40CIH0_9PEZI|nr:hypothetical protein B0T16DRAFT_518705 [Cercophora newfieldiana]